MTFGLTAIEAVSIASGVNSLTGGGVSKMLGFGGSPTGAQAQSMADPFSPYRGKLGQMYSDYLQPGASSNIEAMPGFSQYKTGVLDPAMKTSQRTAAKSGMLYSGNEQMELQKVGQQGYYGFMTDYLNRLAQGSGAANNPATAAGMGLNQTGANQQGFSQGLGALGTLAGQFGGSTANASNNYQYSSPVNTSGAGADFGNTATGAENFMASY
jgi:hypothetical protein